MTIEIPAWSETALEVMRIGLGLTVLVVTSKMHVFRPTGEPTDPVGIARLTNLRWAAQQPLVRWVRYGVFIATLCLVAEVATPFALLYLSVVLLIETTFRSSFGSVSHGGHLVLVVVVVQTLAVLVWNAADRWDWQGGVLLASSRPATAAWWSVQAMLAVYFTSGLSKLINTKAGWVHRSPGLLLSARSRSDTDEHLTRDRPPLAERSAPLVAWLLAHPGRTRALFAGGLMAELLSPVGLLDDRVLVAVGLALLALHWVNGWLLRLSFPEYQLLVATFFVVPTLLF